MFVSICGYVSTHFKGKKYLPSKILKNCFSYITMDLVTGNIVAQWCTHPTWNLLDFGCIHRIWPINIWLNAMSFQKNVFLIFFYLCEWNPLIVIWSKTTLSNFCFGYIRIEEGIKHQFAYLLHVILRNTFLVVSWYNNNHLLIYVSNTTISINWYG